ncbi:urease accessory protein UreE [Orrella daihaiensis]|uniref:Urease accessory protein UreE n=1 Tax=Orrella daihaiensis TaxID=2782176 RepID=A0ABY4AIL6_9BURK|nr:urease accessory protein UreE [Orrella daihaiensis]UOD49481.1 urease accessory protein UreE [Orrella daihaiensis]
MPVLYDKLIREVSQLSLSDAQVVQLTCNERQRNRLALMLPDGQAAAVVLPRGQFLQANDVLLSANGNALIIQAAVEPLMQIRADTNLSLMRMIYHLANRHVRAMIREGAILIEPDAVLEKMILQLGGHVEMVEQVFEPESGAYAGGHHHHGDDEPLDRAMGNIGEMLSIAAHHARGNHHD